MGGRLCDGFPGFALQAHVLGGLWLESDLESLGEYALWFGLYRRPDGADGHLQLCAVPGAAADGLVCLQEFKSGGYLRSRRPRQRQYFLHLGQMGARQAWAKNRDPRAKTRATSAVRRYPIWSSGAAACPVWPGGSWCRRGANRGGFGRHRAGQRLRQCSAGWHCCNGSFSRACHAHAADGRSHRAA